MSDDLRASNAERELAVVRLRDAAADGRLTLEELAARTGDAYLAQTRGELVQLTTDLPAAPQRAPETRERPGLVVGVFAPVRRRGRWRVRRRTIVLSLFAPASLDLRPSMFEHEEATITVMSLFAPVVITVPEHVDVEVAAVSVFAPVRETGAPGKLAAAAPRIRVNGLSLFAPIVVEIARS